MKRNASAIWQGPLKNGNGKLTTDSQVLSGIPYSFKTRFENEKGTNPEELVGAAHAGCFSMALSGELEKMQLTPDSIETRASVNLEKLAEGWAVTGIHLQVSARVPGASQSDFQKAAEIAKANCPISKLLKAEITMDASLKLAEADSPQEVNF